MSEPDGHRSSAVLKMSGVQWGSEKVRVEAVLGRRPRHRSPDGVDDRLPPTRLGTRLSPQPQGGSMAERWAAARLVAPEGSLVPGVLVGVAASGWWWSARMAHEMAPGTGMASSMGRASMSLAAFVGGWVAMMAAMMFPAVMPVVNIFRRASGRARLAPTPVFVAGYLSVWSAIGVPAFFAWRALEGPIGDNVPWAGRLAGAVFLAAAAYQVSPLKSVCLRHCRSPMSFFLHQRRDLRRPIGAATAGATHGLVCLGCCWALMAILVALGTMQVAWMVGLAALIFIEKVTPIGERVAAAAAVAFSVLGLGLVIHPALLSRLS